MLFGQLGLNISLYVIKEHSGSNVKDGARTRDVSNDSCIARTSQVTSVAANCERYSLVK